MTERQTRTIEWRDLFKEDILEEGLRLCSDGAVRNLFINTPRHFCSASVSSGRFFNYQVQVYGAPFRYRDEWSNATFRCSCQRRNWGPLCAHLAALMFSWEERVGSWTFTETEEEAEARVRREESRAKRERLQREKEEKLAIREDPSLFINRILHGPDPEQESLKAGSYFDLGRILKANYTTRYHTERAEALAGSSDFRIGKPELLFNEYDEQVLRIEGFDYCSSYPRRTFLEVSREGFRESSCFCGASWDQICEHKLALLSELQKCIEKDDPGDFTNAAGLRFLNAFSGGKAEIRSLGPDNAPGKEKSVRIAPRLLLDSEGKLKLCFRIGHSGKRMFNIRSIEEFLNALEDENTLDLGKSDRLDFSLMEPDEESEKWVVLMKERSADMKAANKKIAARTYRAVPQLSALAQEPLEGSLLDRFYDLAENSSVDFQDRSGENPSNSLRVGHEYLKIGLTAEPILNGESLAGVVLRADIPRILSGGSSRYLFSDTGLSRLTREENETVLPFLSASRGVSQKEEFSFGRGRLQELAYRILPAFRENPYIEVTDLVGDFLTQELPPEPEFEFRMDIQDSRLLLTEHVRYGEDALNLPDSTYPAKMRDPLQEERVERVIRQYFPEPPNEEKQYVLPVDDDALYRMMNEMLPALSRYGTVLGSDAFSRIRLRPVPSVRVGLSVESDLMDLSFISKEIEPEELLKLLESYRKKKRYHRLRSGDFISLAEDEGLQTLDSLVTELHLTEDAFSEGKVRLPLYRALYLNRVMEEHEALSGDRDRNFRKLVRAFRTVSDAEFEPPENMKETLRPYQLYGFKWLRTLYGAGFGGILADEMGLGKTIQVIGLFEALKQERLSDGTQRPDPFLVVCPASLVYNWLEEIRRFAPDLTAAVINGTAGQRSRILRDLSAADVFITSYDLLRKDILLYEDLKFDIAVLDEAQYIKNQKAAASKAAKALHAAHRFALTGTPIENRLAELYSIFDYLMPGYLFRYDEFQQRFEVPIVKNHSESRMTELQRMTGPFILRRLKKDVLKDLPAKLEEVRYAHLDGEQRKLYDAQVARMRKMILENGAGNGEEKIRILAELTKIREICCDPGLLFEGYKGESAKREACLDLIQSAIDGGHRMLVFSQFTSMLALLEEDLRKEGISYLKITGQTPKEDRLALVHEFNGPEGPPVFLISLKAGGTGLNLVGADVVIHYDPWWNLAVQNQATDRAHRIGQTREVSVFKLIGKDTVEEKILALQEAKRELAEAILSGGTGSLMSLTPEELLALLE